jgi:hypothetical protein
MPQELHTTASCGPCSRRLKHNGVNRRETHTALCLFHP